MFPFLPNADLSRTVLGGKPTMKMPLKRY